MASFPTPWTVQHLRWSSAGTDAHGNPVEGHTPEDAKVYGWAAPAPEERTNERVVIDMRLYGPPALTVDSRDQFVIPEAGTFEVQGPVQNYNHGPFGWAPGVVVNLQRIEG